MGERQKGVMGLNGAIALPKQAILWQVSDRSNALIF